MHGLADRQERLLNIRGEAGIDPISVNPDSFVKVKHQGEAESTDG